jgi:hypothetical protein
MHDLVVRYLNLKARRELDWLPKIPEGTGEDDVTRFADEALRRKMLRLLANSAIEVLRVRADEEQYSTDFRSGLRKIRRMNSQASAAAANSRLLQLFEWETEEHGESAGGQYWAAASLSDLLLNSYNGWPEDKSYDDAADHYSTVVSLAEMSPKRQELVTTVLAELKKLEEK